MFDRCMQTRCREDPVLPYPLVHRRHRLMRFYATTLFSLFQSGLIFREICLRRIFTIAEPKTMRAGMSACQHRFSSSLPYEHPPAAAPFFRFGRGGRARMSARGNRFRRSRPVRSGRFCGKKSAICRMKRGLEAHLRKLRNSSVQKLQKAKAEIDHCNKNSRNANFFQKIY